MGVGRQVVLTDARADDRLFEYSALRIWEQRKSNRITDHRRLHTNCGWTERSVSERYGATRVSNRLTVGALRNMHLAYNSLINSSSMQNGILVAIYSQGIMNFAYTTLV